MISGWRVEKEIISINYQYNPFLVGGRSLFDGYGSAQYGGRWNHVGTPIVYISECLALAALEVFVHLPLSGRSIDHVYFRFDIPSKVRIENISLSSLSAGWRAEPAPDFMKDIGTKWAKEARTAVLKVPSVIIPLECNLLLNPLHPDFKKITISDPEAFSFDPRIWK